MPDTSPKIKPPHGESKAVNVAGLVCLSGQFPSWWCRRPEELKDEAQFALPPKGANVVEMLCEHHHRQYDAVCDVVIEQHNYWLEDQIRAELVIHYGAVAYASYTYVCHC
jgi:hypothetical protein